MNTMRLLLCAAFALYIAHGISNCWAQTTTSTSSLSTESVTYQTDSNRSPQIVAASAQTTGTAETTATRRINYDQVGPNDNATTRPFEEVTAVLEDRGRTESLKSAAFADIFKEHAGADFRFYRNLVPGNESDPTEGKRFEETREKFGANIGRQPAGPLTSRIVFASAGHGWTNDNTSTSLWYTQRPITHGIIEDFGNLDQMNLYADLCFRAGATIVPLRPIGFQHIERVIDNVSGHAGFHGEWADSQSTVSFKFAGAEVPYRFARASVEETAIARFRPIIPVTDLYPVYCWARAGADRVIQTYRIVHGGGVNEVDIDHRRVGNGWVYLGSYNFRKGNYGYVEVTNRVREAEFAAQDRVVIADAIRFGNGMGDSNRGGGVSRSPREEEASRYWVEQSIADGIPPIYDAFADRGDQSNNVGSAPRFAAHMNSEVEGGFFDRVFLSFHSNAVGGRGVVGLYNAHAQLRPDHQIELAKLVADELNKQMMHTGLPLEHPWNVRPVRTDGHINFGEIRRDYLNNEMSATIVEVAFHDDPQDAALLRKLSVRREVAQAAYRATLRFFSETGNQKIRMQSPPSAPRLLSARQSDDSETVLLEWSSSEDDPFSSPSESIRYKVYRSGDGLAFDHGTDVGTRTSFAIKDLLDNEPVYVKVTAISDGGESLSSAILGVARSSGPRILVVHGAPTVSDDAALTQTEPSNLGSPLRGGGDFVRLVPRIMNNGEQALPVGSGADRLNIGFDSVTMSEFLAHPVERGQYRAICIQLGRSPVPDGLATTAVLTALHDHITSDGCLLISGACLAECEGLAPDSLQRWGEFVSTTLQTGFAPQTTKTHIIKSGEQALTTVTLQLGNRNLRYFTPRPTEVLLPLENGRPVLAYENFDGIAAVATLKDKLLKTVIVGFPIEELDSRDEQSVLMGQMFLAMGMELQSPPKKSGISASKVSITDSKPDKGGVPSDEKTTATKD